MPVSIRPVAGKILLRPIPAPAAAGPIIVPTGDERARSRRAHVIAIAPSCKDPGVAPGDEVLLMPYRGAEVRVNGETLVFVKPSELEVVLEP